MPRHIYPSCLRAIAAMALCGASSAGIAQDFPSRALRIVVTFPAGSSPDIVARILGNLLAAQVGQQVVVDPRSGAAGVIGVEAAKNAAADGSTLLLAGGNEFATLPALRSKLPYDADRDFVGLTRVASVAYVIAVHPTLGVASVGDLLKLAKARPGELNYGSSGTGSATHIGGEMLNILGGIKTVHVPYKGASLAITDLIVGQIQIVVASPIFLMPHTKAGRIKPIATTGLARDPLLPDLPTAHTTLPGFEITQWWGLFAHAKTPPALMKTLHAEITKATQSAEVREQLARHYASSHADTPAELAAHIKSERERIARIGKRMGLALD